MTVRIEETTREQVAIFLPKAIQKTWDSYHAFMDKDIASDTKEFSSHHMACKVAIAHLELLIKLARWADLEESEADTSLAESLFLALNETNANRDKAVPCGVNHDGADL